MIRFKDNTEFLNWIKDELKGVSYEDMTHAEKKIWDKLQKTGYVPDKERK